MNILFVDDQVASIGRFIAAVEKEFPKPQNSVTHATTIGNGLDILRGPNSVDVLILDIDMNGDYDAGLKFLRENGPWLLTLDVLVIVLSNRGANDLKVYIKSLLFETLNEDTGALIPVGFSDKQLQVFQKFTELLPVQLPRKISELFLIFRPLG